MRFSHTLFCLALNCFPFLRLSAAAAQMTHAGRSLRISDRWRPMDAEGKFPSPESVHFDWSPLAEPLAMRDALFFLGEVGAKLHTLNIFQPSCVHLSVDDVQSLIPATPNLEAFRLTSHHTRRSTRARPWPVWRHLVIMILSMTDNLDSLAEDGLAPLLCRSVTPALAQVQLRAEQLKQPFADLLVREVYGRVSTFKCNFHFTADVISRAPKLSRLVLVQPDLRLDMRQSFNRTSAFHNLRELDLKIVSRIDTPGCRALQALAHRGTLNSLKLVHSGLEWTAERFSAEMFSPGTSLMALSLRQLDCYKWRTWKRKGQSVWVCLAAELLLARCRWQCAEMVSVVSLLCGVSPELMRVYAGAREQLLRTKCVIAFLASPSSNTRSSAAASKRCGKRKRG